MTTDATAPRFDDAVVAGVIAHMNADHGADTLLICRALGDRDSATAAEMVDLDADGGDYRVTVDGVDEVIRIPWERRLDERIEIRREVVRMYDEACGILGVTPRAHE